MPTRVVNLYRDAFDVYIGRPGKGQPGYFGNPIKLEGITREECIEMYRCYFLDRIATDQEFKQRVLELRGKTLGCFCKQPGKSVLCHGDVIAEWLDSQPELTVASNRRIDS